MINTNISNINHSALQANSPQPIKTNLHSPPLISKNSDTVEISEKGKSISSAKGIMSRYDINNISPREMSNMSLELHLEGVISFEEHALMSFQPELNQEQYNKITGNHANPDISRDFIDEWENKLETQKKSGAPQEFIKKAEDILALLKNLNDL